MARFSGIVGYVNFEETAPGVHSEVVTEKQCYGEVIRNTRRWETSQQLNDNLVINNQFSIVADDYAYQNFKFMRFIKWMGSSWKITNVEIDRPRLLLTIGGVYNAP